MVATMLTIGEINTALATTLGTADGIVSIQDAAQPDEATGLKEGLPDLPALQVYWESAETDEAGPTDRTTFGAGVRQTKYTYSADLYVRQRSQLSEDVAAVLTMAEAMDAVFKAQTTNLFGQERIQAFKWSAKRVTFENSGVEYAGARFTIEVWSY